MYTVAGKFKFCFELSEIFLIFSIGMVESKLQMQRANCAAWLLLKALPTYGHEFTLAAPVRRGKVDQLPIHCGFQHSEVPSLQRPYYYTFFFSNLRCWLFPKWRLSPYESANRKYSPLQDPFVLLLCTVFMWNCPQSSTQLGRAAVGPRGWGGGNSVVPFHTSSVEVKV